MTAMRAALMTNSRSLSRQEYSHTQRHTPSPDVSGRYSPGPPLRPLSTSPNLKERPGILRRGRAVGDRRASSPQQRFSDVSAGYTDYRQHSPLLRQRKSEGQVKVCHLFNLVVYPFLCAQTCVLFSDWLVCAPHDRDVNNCQWVWS